MGCHFLLQGIFPTQGSNPALLHCGQTLYHLSHQGVGGYFLLQGIFPTQELNLHCVSHFSYIVSRFFTTSATWEAQPTTVLYTMFISDQLELSEELSSSLSWT